MIMERVLFVGNPGTVSTGGPRATFTPTCMASLVYCAVDTKGCG